MEKMNGEGLSIKDVNIEKLKEIFPECVVEEKIDFEMLKLLLGEKAEIKEDSYRFTWEGKSNAIKIAREASNATLRPEKEKSVNWDKTENLYIEGDNLEALKALTKTYYGKVKMIYIDPPYNTGNDFVYNDDFAESNNKYVFETNQAFRANPETSGKYHRNWLNMMYPRLQVAKQLLSDEGFIFISIDDIELTNLIKICNEIFNESNFIANCFVLDNLKGKTNDNFVSSVGSRLLIYAKNKSISVANGFSPIENIYGDVVEKKYSECDELGFYSKMTFKKTGQSKYREDRPYMFYPILHKDGQLFAIEKNEFENLYDSKTRIFNDKYLLSLKEKYSGYDFILPTDTNGDYLRWTSGFNSFVNKINKDIFYSEGIKQKVRPDPKEMLQTYASGTPKNLMYKTEYSIGTEDFKSLFGEAYFDFPKPVQLLKDIFLLTNDKDAIVLDFFSGSATTAQAVFEQNLEDGGNRKFIMVQLPVLLNQESKAYKAGYKTICDIGEERIRRAAKKIYEEAVEKKEKAGLLASEVVDPDSLDLGFKVFRVDSTNLRAWDSTRQYDEESLFDLIEVVKDGRTELDLVYEIMLKQGVFNMPLEVKKINGKNVYTVADNYLVIFLADDITKEDILEIAKMKPKSVVFKEKGFKNDNDKLNADYTFKRLNVDSIMCL